MYKTYVMHYKPLRDRYEFINRQLTHIRNVEFITEFDRGDLTEKDLQKYNKNPSFHRIVSEISRKPHGIAGSVTYKYKEMTPSSISLNMKHLAAFKRLAKQEEEFAVFLEDDCQFVSNPTRIEGIIKRAPSNWDVMCLGGAFDHGIITPLKIIDGYILADHPATNTTSSMLYKKETVKKILPYVEPFGVPIDWQLNYAFHEAKLNVYHTDPYLCTQADFRSTAND